jgi:hypothetical protein
VGHAYFKANWARGDANMFAVAQQDRSFHSELS